MWGWSDGTARGCLPCILLIQDGPEFDAQHPIFMSAEPGVPPQKTINKTMIYWCINLYFYTNYWKNTIIKSLGHKYTEISTV